MTIEFRKITLIRSLLGRPPTEPKEMPLPLEQIPSVKVMD